MMRYQWYRILVLPLGRPHGNLKAAPTMRIHQLSEGQWPPFLESFLNHNVQISESTTCRCPSCKVSRVSAMERK